ncbi:MAG: hypothetical protein HY671_03155 [Chloroflexi bacterium]|nr:hypothetical protein [Chloroflexota bacterium]
MLTKMDEYPIHQTYTTFDHVADGDPRWFDRFWFMVHDTEGKLCIGHGTGVYPNLSVMDGWAIVSVNNKQRNIRVSRELLHDREKLTIGPLHAEIVDPLQKWRLTLGSNDLGFSYDIEFESLAPPYELNPPAFRRYHNAVETNACHYNQSGRCQGKVTVDGKTFTLDKTRFFGYRDRSWGVRPQVGGPQCGGRIFQEKWPSPRGNFMVANVGGFHLCYMGGERQDGVRSFTGGIVYNYDQNKPPVRITDVQRDFKLSGDRFQTCDMTVSLSRGLPLKMSLRRLNTVFLRGGAYAGLNGYYHGMYRGDLHVEGEVWDLKDDATLDAISGVNDHVVECRLGDKVGYGVGELYYKL